MGAAVTVKTNCGRSVSKDVRGGRFAFSTDGNCLGREREREIPCSDLAHFVSLCCRPLEEDETMAWDRRVSTFFRIRWFRA